MRSQVALVLSLLGAVSARTHPDPISLNVVSLTEDTFDNFMAGHDLALAYFYSPYCGHCRKFAPNYEEAAKILEKENVPLVKVNCIEELELCNNKYDIMAWPTVKVFRGLEAHEGFLGYRETDVIISTVTYALASDSDADETVSYGSAHGQTPIKAEDTD